MMCATAFYLYTNICFAFEHTMKHLFIISENWTHLISITCSHIIVKITMKSFICILIKFQCKIICYWRVIIAWKLFVTLFCCVCFGLCACVSETYTIYIHKCSYLSRDTILFHSLYDPHKSGKGLLRIDNFII